MRNAAFAAHRAAASGLFTLFALIAIVLGLGDPRLLALAMGGALLSLFLLTRAGALESLGAFAAPLAMIADLALLFCAMSLTGGVLSPFALLLPTGVALSWHCDGKPAARFFAAASLFGTAALATIGHSPTAGAGPLFALAGVALAAPALLVALEVAGAATAAAAPAAFPPRLRSSSPSPPASPWRPRRQPSGGNGPAPRRSSSTTSRSATGRRSCSTTCARRSRSSASTPTSSRRPRGAASCRTRSTSPTSSARSSSPSGSSAPRRPRPSPWSCSRSRRTRTSSRSSARSRPRTASRTAAASASSSSPSGPSCRWSPIRSRSSAPSATCSTTPSSTRPTAARCASARAARGRRPSSSSRTPAWA